MTTFDVHQHLLPPPLIDALRARREPPCLAGATLELREGSFPFDEREHDLGERIAFLDRDGTDVAIVSLGPTMETDAHPELRAAYHEGMRELVSATGGRLRAFAAAACLEGFAGACVSAGAVVAGLGELPDELARAGQVLFVHPGPPGPPPRGAPPTWAPVVDYTAQMQAAYFAWLAEGVERPSGLDVIFAILAGGAPFQLERLRARGVEDVAPDPRIYLETSSYGPRALRLCLESFGAEQIVFGSDVPVLDAAVTLQAVADVGDDLLARARTANPARIFR
ncbi:MAG: amidohydrolase family protein [Gaiellaceae bacterium]